MGEDKERRVDLVGDLGYIKGSLDALHPKIDSMQRDISANSGRIGNVEKQISKYKHVLVGIVGVLSTAWTGALLFWSDIQKAIQHLFHTGGT